MPTLDVITTSNIAATLAGRLQLDSWLRYQGEVVQVRTCIARNELYAIDNANSVLFGLEGIQALNATDRLREEWRRANP